MTAAVLACIDGSAFSASVADHAGWAARRLGVGVELLQALGEAEHEAPASAGSDADLPPADGEGARRLRAEGRLTLAAARRRVEAAGVTHGVAEILRPGRLLETLAEREADTALVVVGKRGAAAAAAGLPLGAHLEPILRASHRPTLVAPGAFRWIERFVIAFDGRPGALKAVDDACRSPLLHGLSGLVMTAGGREADATAALEAAARRLRAAGLAVEPRVAPGPPEAAIPAAVRETGADLLVMGAYGHSRLRGLVLGSVTSAMIGACRAPILVHR